MDLNRTRNPPRAPLPPNEIFHPLSSVAELDRQKPPNHRIVPPPIGVKYFPTLAPALSRTLFALAYAGKSGPCRTATHPRLFTPGSAAEIPSRDWSSRFA